MPNLQRTPTTWEPMQMLLADLVQLGCLSTVRLMRCGDDDEHKTHLFTPRLVCNMRARFAIIAKVAPQFALRCICVLPFFVSRRRNYGSLTHPRYRATTTTTELRRIAPLSDSVLVGVTTGQAEGTSAFIFMRLHRAQRRVQRR